MLMADVFYFFVLQDSGVVTHVAVTATLRVLDCLWLEKMTPTIHTNTVTIPMRENEKKRKSKKTVKMKSMEKQRKTHTKKKKKHKIKK